MGITANNPEDRELKALEEKDFDESEDLLAAGIDFGDEDDEVDNTVEDDEDGVGPPYAGED